MALTNEEIMRATEIALRQHGAVLREAVYEPRIWNDSGVYNYFYIDFLAPMAQISLGMFETSIVVHDSTQLQITSATKINDTTYKIGCNISGKVTGITVLNKQTSLLKFFDGSKVKPFSGFFYVAGIVPYVRTDYWYEYVPEIYNYYQTSIDAFILGEFSTGGLDVLQDQCIVFDYYGSVSETLSCTLT